MPARTKQWKVGSVTLNTDEAIDYLLSSGKANPLLDMFEADFNVRNTAAGVLYAYNKEAYFDEAHVFYKRMAQADPEGFAEAMGITSATAAKAPAKRPADKRPKTKGARR